VWTHKASYQQIFSDRFLMDFQYANVGGGFQLDFPNPEEQFHVQRRLELNGNFWAPANEIAGSGEKSVQATSLLDGQRSLALNDARDRWNSPASYLDPTCTAASCQPEQQYAPESGGSGIDNIFNNARWLFKASGFYATPLWDINVGAFYNARQGYPNPTFVLTPSRPTWRARRACCCSRWASGGTRPTTTSTSRSRSGSTSASAGWRSAWRPSTSPTTTSCSAGTAR
jgi:hypothetical protein